jgi:hypothetical protein
MYSPMLNEDIKILYAHITNNLKEKEAKKLKIVPKIYTMIKGKLPSSIPYNSV